MKKGISILLVAVLLLLTGVTGWAEESGITAEKVFQWLDEGDEASETTEDQAANGALRLAEMMVVLDSISIETDDEVDYLNGMLDELAKVDVQGENNRNMLAVGLIKTFEGLAIFEQQLDSEGTFADTLQQIVDSYNEGDDKMQNATGQAVNALYHSVYLASLIAQELSPDQVTADQIQEELAAFSAGDEAASDVWEQLANGGEYLFRMLTGIASMSAPDDSFEEDILKISEDNYDFTETESDAAFLTANWLYGCVAMTGVIVDEMQA